MTYVTEGRQPEKALRFFEELCAIPRPSGGEAKVADWLCEFAKARGLECHRDELGDVIIKRPGKGDALMLQGHTDMVSAVAPEKGASDAIAYLAEHGVKPILDGDLLHADGTTLGADNGVAVAMMLAILDTPELKAPPLECVFTVQEETGLFGAKAVDGSLISARRMINLDSEKDGMLTVSCAGGCRIAIEREFSVSEVGECALRLDVGGLLGGHSGEQIHLPRENAIHLCARVAGLLRIGGRLAWIRGGEADNAIPRSCSALIVYSSVERMENAKARFAELAFDYPHEPELKITLHDAKPEPALADGEDLFEMLAALPNGVQARDERNGFVLTSLNCGVISTDGGKLRATLSLRSSVAENMVKLKETVIAAAEKFGFNAIVGAEYPGWAFREVSPLRDTLMSAWKRVTGDEMKVQSIHAGLECGLFSAKFDGLDAVALGPTIHDCHTPQESLDLNSLERTWKTLVAALEMLAE